MLRSDASHASVTHAAPPALSRATSVEGLQISNLDPQRIKASYPALYFHQAPHRYLPLPTVTYRHLPSPTVTYPALYFHQAASAASAQRNDAPLEAHWAKSHFWWLPIVEAVNPNPRWLELYEEAFEAWQLRRWRAKYTVPPHLQIRTRVSATGGVVG